MFKTIASKGNKNQITVVTRPNAYRYLIKKQDMRKTKFMSLWFPVRIKAAETL
jgi:hypothetical protein